MGVEARPGGKAPERHQLSRQLRIGGSHSVDDVTQHICGVHAIREHQAIRELESDTSLPQRIRGLVERNRQVLDGGLELTGAQLGRAQLEHDVGLKRRRRLLVQRAP